MHTHIIGKHDLHDMIRIYSRPIEAPNAALHQLSLPERHLLSSTFPRNLIPAKFSQASIALNSGSGLPAVNGSLPLSISLKCIRL